MKNFLVAFVRTYVTTVAIWLIALLVLNHEVFSDKGLFSIYFGGASCLGVALGVTNGIRAARDPGK